MVVEPAQNGFTSGLTQPIQDFGELPSPAVTALVFLTEDDGWMGTSEPGSTLFRTKDSGRTWTSASLDDHSSVVAIDCADVARCVVETAKGRWSTADGGDTWQQQTP